LRTRFVRHGLTKDGGPNNLPKSRLVRTNLPSTSDLAILRQLKTGYLATARLFGAEGFHWIHRRGAMRGNITGEERRESKHGGYCYKSWEVPRAHSEQQSS